MLNIIKKFTSAKAVCESPEDCPFNQLKKQADCELTLAELLPGESCVVKSVSNSEPRLCCKLHAMGIVEGQKVSVKQRAPFGDPISIATLGYTLSLRICEARAIQVERV